MDLWQSLSLFLLFFSPCRLHKTAILDFCQNSQDKLFLRDIVLPNGSGLLHKFDDFMQACEMAIRSNRVLVDYIPKLSPVLGFRALYGNLEKYHGRRDIVVPWTFGNFFNLSKFDFDVQYKNVSFALRVFVTFLLHFLWIFKGQSKTCRLKFSPTEKVVKRSSLASIEYSNVRATCKTCHYRVDEKILRNSALDSDKDILSVKLSNKQRPFNNFVKSMALRVRNQLLSKFSRDAFNQRQFVAIHLRAYDRPCLIENLTPKLGED